MKWATASVNAGFASQMKTGNFFLALEFERTVFSGNQSPAELTADFVFIQIVVRSDVLPNPLSGEAVMGSSGARGQPEECGTWAGAFVVKVASDHRVLIPKLIRESVLWLVEAGSSVNCEVRWLGDVPALELQPCTDEIGQPDAEFSGLFQCSEPDHRQLLRARASRWRVRLERHGQVCRFNLPEPIRRIGLLPGKNGDIVLLGYQDILELWKPEDWYENLRNICHSESAQLTRQVLSTDGVHPHRRGK